MLKNYVIYRCYGVASDSTSQDKRNHEKLFPGFIRSQKSSKIRTKKMKALNNKKKVKYFP
jgi:hypothetical protein